jgi:hypothetical protein
MVPAPKGVYWGTRQLDTSRLDSIPGTARYVGYFCAPGTLAVRPLFALLLVRKTRQHTITLHETFFSQVAEPAGYECRIV